MAHDKDYGTRQPYNGRPYYCIKCGSGFNEFMACELPHCELESPMEAIARKKAKEKDDQDSR